jgi:hypothetical protein
MTDNSSKPDTERPDEGAQSSPAPAKIEKRDPDRFNPFVNEDDMFKVVLVVAGAALVFIAVAVIIQSL